MDAELLITPLYAGIFGLMLIALSARVIGQRRKHKQSLGEGQAPELARAIRAQGNFVEYVPFALFLMLLGELNGADRLLTHALGTALLVGRTLHATGLLIAEVHPDKPQFAYRVSGMMLTFFSLGIASAHALWQFIALYWLDQAY
jgi:uncharacterized membrane protein YecN with MAPEG domain